MIRRSKWVKLSEGASTRQGDKMTKMTQMYWIDSTKTVYCDLAQDRAESRAEQKRTEWNRCSQGEQG